MEVWQWRSRDRRATTTFDNLPNECLQEIFSRVITPYATIPLGLPHRRHWHFSSGVRHPLHCSLVCKRWRAAVDPAVKSLRFDITTPVGETLIRHLPRFLNLTSITLTDFSNNLGSFTLEDFFTALAAATPQLEELTLEEMCESRPTGLSMALTNALPAWGRLRTLTLGDRFYEENGAELLTLLDLLKHTPSLENVTISSELYRTETSLAVLDSLRQIRPLRELELRLLNCRVPINTICRRLLQMASIPTVKMITSKAPPPSMTALTALKELRIAESEDDHLPDTLGALRSLTCLELDLCLSLVDLPASIGRLSALRRLNLEQCDDLTVLPQSLGNMQALEYLQVWFCESLVSLPDTLGNLHSLGCLNISNCPSLSELPESVGQLHQLTHLEVSGCDSFRQLPDTICQLSKLTQLLVRGCKELKHLPRNIGALSKLRVLNAGLGSLQDLPPSICHLASLERLDIVECSLKRLPLKFGQIQGLQELYLDGCANLDVLPDGIGNLRSLTAFTISKCPKLQLLPECIALLTRLGRLHLHGSVPGTLQRFPGGVAVFKDLRELWVDAGPAEQWLPLGLSKLTSLERLGICGPIPEQLQAARGRGVFQMLGGLWRKGVLFGSSQFGDLRALQRLQHLTLEKSCEHLPRELLKMSALTMLSWHTTLGSDGLLFNKEIICALKGRGCRVCITAK